MTALSTILTVVFLLVTAAIFILPLDKLLGDETNDNENTSDDGTGHPSLR